MMNSKPLKKLYKIAGEGQINIDGSHRQSILRSCLPGMTIALVREAANPFDSSAIAVHIAQTDQLIGYISRTDAATLAPYLDAGWNFKARIHELTGGMPEFTSFGCVICVVSQESPLLDLKSLRPEQVYYANSTLSTGASHPSKPIHGAWSSGAFLKSLFKALLR